MPGISQRRFYSTIRRPSAEALEILAANSDDIFATWQREVRALGLPLNEFMPATALNFARLAENLRKITYPAFRQQLLHFGEMLAQRGVRLDIGAAALNRLYEICLPALIQDLPERATPILALARLHALVHLLIVSGYTGQWAAGKKNLVEASLSEAEDRRYGASAYVTRVYEQERRRLSHDLHDEIGHDLIIIKLHLEMIALSNNSKDLEGETRLTEAIALVSHAIDAVRRLVFDLGPAVDQPGMACFLEGVLGLERQEDVCDAHSTHMFLAVVAGFHHLPAKVGDPVRDHVQIDGRIEGSRRAGAAAAGC